MQARILQKLNIEALNEMQIAAQAAIRTKNEVILLSPTGSGKTLAFLLPIVEKLRAELSKIQAVVIVPSRELAIQIEQVAREMGTGLKINAFYGGRSFNKDRMDLNHPPALLIGTPGRVADHLRRRTFEIDSLKILVLDEFDKSLEIGFESDMRDIVNTLSAVERKILTSATSGIEIPNFLALKNPQKLDFLGDSESKLQIKMINSPTKDKLETLEKVLKSLAGEPGIIFCNYKDNIQYVSDFLSDKGIAHGCFFGGMEQQDRERALIKFRNGTHQLIIATDLAARGIDIPELKFIIHYQLPNREEEFIHRNGRTARMNAEGTAYVIAYPKSGLPHYMVGFPSTDISEVTSEEQEAEITNWATVFVSGGRGDKISKGDIAGYFMKVGGLSKDEIGSIELKQDCAFVGVLDSKADKLIALLNNTKLKTKKVRMYLA
ncbi:DbpA RNA binding domain-containing protein [Spirosomataceae bacterium TFI 002]|nr:DbpA RNA binding domain-containing protein [Spirosomataceae bacterium TFI 002]